MSLIYLQLQGYKADHNFVIHCKAILFPNSLHTSNNFQQSDSLFAEIISQIFQCFIIFSNNCVLLSFDHYLDYFNFSFSLYAQDPRSSNLCIATIEIKMVSGHFWITAKFLQNKCYKSLSFNIMDNGSEQTCGKFLIRRKRWTGFKSLAIRGVYTSGLGVFSILWIYPRIWKAQVNKYTKEWREACHLDTVHFWHDPSVFQSA